MIIRAKITKGQIKWNAKNRVRVGASTEAPPHNHWVKMFPMKGIEDKRLVITVAPHRDIWPQGKT